MYKRKKAFILCILAAAGISGCITSSFDPTLMHQYQRHLVRSGPQQRQADSLIKQVPGTTGPPLQTRIDGETGRTQVLLTIDEAVSRALANNTAVKVIAFDPAVAREDVIIAEAEFDTIFTAQGQFDKTDTTSRSAGLPDQTETTAVSTALSQKLITGGQAVLSYSVERANSKPNVWQFDPVYTQTVAVELTQPLLRDAGPTINLAQIRVSRLNENISMDQFRATVLDVISETQSLYWNLYASQRELGIRQELTSRSEATLAMVRARKHLDASSVQITDAESTVATNRLSMIRAQRRIGDARDRLVRVMADASITLLDDFEIVLQTPVSTTPLIIDPVDQVATALKYSPELAQARTAIRIQDINVKVARNQVLPRLDVTSGVGVNGVNDALHNSWDKLWGGDYVNWNVGLSFEWPIGNRARQANLRKARYNRAKSVASLQDSADQVAVAVNDAVRQIDSSYDLIVAGRAALNANQGNLTALEVRKRFRQALTPDFLNRLLLQQTNVAQAELELLVAEVTFTTAQSTLARVTGTSLDDMGVLIADTDADVDPVPPLLSRLSLTGEAAPAGAIAPPAILQPRTK